MPMGKHQLRKYSNMETIQTAAPPPVVTSGGGGGGDDESAPLPPPHLPPMKHRSASTSGGGGGGGGVKGGKGRGAGGLPSQSVEEKVCTACCVLFMSSLLCFVRVLVFHVRTCTVAFRRMLTEKLRSSAPKLVHILIHFSSQ